MSNQANLSTTSMAIPKKATGISGLDEVLMGGIPEGRTTLIRGGPGSGKTVLGLEILYRGALAGDPGIFITFEEAEDDIHRNAKSLGWDLEALEQNDELIIMQANAPNHLVISGDFEIDGLLGIIRGQIEAIGARRIVIDAIDRLLLIFRDPLKLEGQLYALHHWLNERNITAILTAKHDNNQSNLYLTLDYLVDCVLHLTQQVVGQVMTRRLRVLKYRGSGFLTNQHPFVITNHGFEMIPVSTSQLNQKPLGEAFSTGNKELDRILGGGFREGASVLIAGSSGTGKTTLACSLTLAACSQGKKCLYISFEESGEALTETMLSPGIELRPAIENQDLTILTALPESLGVEEHLLKIMSTIRILQPEFVVLETISAARRLGSDQAAFDFVVRLVDICKHRGITTILINQSRPVPITHFPSIEDISGIGISSLIDSLLLLEQKWSSDSYERRLLVIKSRGVVHSHNFHTFNITDHGIVIVDPPGEKTEGHPS